LISRIYKEIERYFFDYYNDTSHGSSVFTPNEKQAESESRTGAAISIAYDTGFLIDTAHSAAERKYTIDNRRGIRIFQRSYWHDGLANPRLQGYRAEVRVEPFDSSLVYANVDGEWLKCFGARHSELSSLDEISRWAQSAIDYFGLPIARAARRAADEKFAKQQAVAWRRPVEATECIASDGHLLEVARGAQVSATPPDHEAPNFQRLRTIELEPFEE
jgi:putative transposase